MRLFNYIGFTYIFQILIIHLFANVSFLAELNGIDLVFMNLYEFSDSMDLISVFFSTKFFCLHSSSTRLFLLSEWLHDNFLNNKLNHHYFMKWLIVSQPYFKGFIV